MSLQKVFDSKVIPFYNHVNSVNNAIDVHYYGEFPKKLVEAWRPETLQDQRLLKIYKGVFKPKTRQIFIDSLEKTFTKFINSEYTQSIINDNVAEYLETVDLNAVLKELYYKTILRPNNSFVILEIEGEIVIFNELLIKDEDSYYFESGEKFYKINKNSFEIGIQDGSFVEWTSYPLNYNPILSPIGIESKDKNQIYLSSIYESLLIMLDEAIIEYLDSRIGFNRSNYFNEIQKQIDCNNDECDGGLCVDKDGKHYNCHTCNGTGKLEIRSIFNKTIVPFNDSNVGSDLAADKYVAFVEPPLNNVKYAEEKFDKTKAEIQEQFFAPVNKNVGESEEALKLRLENIKSWYSYLGDMFFKRYAGYAYCVSNILAGDNYTKITAPKDYDVEEIESKIQNFADLKKVSPFFAKEYFNNEILSKNYTDDIVIKKQIEVLQKFDKLYYLDEDRINTRKSQQAYALDDLQKHDLGGYIVSSLAELDGFEDMEIDELLRLAEVEFSKIKSTNANLI